MDCPMACEYDGKEEAGELDAMAASPSLRLNIFSVSSPSRFPFSFPLLDDGGEDMPVSRARSEGLNEKRNGVAMLLGLSACG